MKWLQASLAVRHVASQNDGREMKPTFGLQSCVCLVFIVMAGCSNTPTLPSTPIPTPPPSGADPFVVTTNLDPLFVGAGRAVTPESPPVPNYVGWDMKVAATGTLRGTIQHVDLTLRDRQSGAVLGTDADRGPFLFPTKTGLSNPLLDTGSQALSYYKVLGFSGSDAILRADVAIKDQTGRDWTASREMVWKLFPPPAPRAPVGITVSQNDPRSGCSFDPVHGYGVVIDLAWDPPADSTADDYIVAIADGAGTEFYSPFYAHTAQTSLRLVRCNTHVPLGAERGARFAVSAQNFTYHTLSAWGVAHFTFQSCREAGTPACQ